MKVVILMGGKSSRMGQEKAFVQFQGQSLFERVKALAASIDEEYYLSVSYEQFESLGHEYRCILDVVSGKGPLGGIVSALAYLRDDILVLPIDLPNLDLETLKPLMKAGKTSAYKAGMYIQSLPSYWSYSDFKDIQDALDQEQLNLKSFFKENVNLISYEGDTDVFLNINRPEDLK